MLMSEINQFHSIEAIILLITMVIKLVTCTGGEDHCYSDIGCFPLSEEFYHPRHRPFNVRPWHRSRIRTQFELYNTRHPDGFILRPWNRINLLASGFNPKLETKIIVPGWLDNIERALWVRHMKNSFQYFWHPINLIVVYWRNFTPYTIATANTRVVGAELANLIKFIEHELNYDRSYNHIIGHSLGAHIGGYCGDRLPGLGRITALDPARPFFQNMPKSVRLDRGDAKFVDAIHSDFTPENAIFLLMSFGMTTPVGHLDFYPNGPPLFQPGCLRDALFAIQTGIQKGVQHSSLSVAFLESVRYLTACDHQRSHEWFIESITNRHCVFVGVRCNEFEGLINGRCTCDDSRSACAIMGIHADQMYMHGVHQEIWPNRNRLPGSSGHRPPPRPAQPVPIPPPALPQLPQTHQLQPLPRPYSTLKDPLLDLGLEENNQLIDQDSISKESMYSELKYYADQLRHPPGPTLPLTAEKALYDGLEDQLQDIAFTEYLRNNLLLNNQASTNNKRQQSSMKRRSSSDPPPSKVAASPRAYSSDHDQFGFEYLLPPKDEYQPANEHPKLLSDHDRDIENWYEDTSRWYLKTNNRPNYCVNQYQLLVYLGPLKTSNGQRRLRANLLISIIGSRGQLVNQRFVPRSANLDEFTMQPFFILLEGSYSLGNIQSVAVGWEARYDPDPIQATITFQSSLLEDIQSHMPALRTKYPWFADTVPEQIRPPFIQSQHSWQQPIISLGGNPNQFLSNIGIHLDRRSDQQVSKVRHPSRSKSISKTSDYGDCRISNRIGGGGNRASSQCSAINRRSTTVSITHSTTTTTPIPTMLRDGRQLMMDDYGEPISEYSDINDDMSVSESHLQNLVDVLDYEQREASMISQILHEPQQNIVHPQVLVPMGPLEPLPRLPHQQHDSIETSESHLKAELHNIHLHEEHNYEDSIVINEVVVSPLQATYGKDGIKTSKIFCPPHRGFKLTKDHTVKLVPNLMGKCNQMPRIPHLYRHPLSTQEIY